MAALIRGSHSHIYTSIYYTYYLHVNWYETCMCLENHLLKKRKKLKNFLSVNKAKRLPSTLIVCCVWTVSCLLLKVQQVWLICWITQYLELIPTPPHTSQPKDQSQANCIATSERPRFPYMYNQDRLFQGNALWKYSSPYPPPL